MSEIISIKPENRPPDLIEFDKLEFRDRTDVYGVDHGGKHQRLSYDTIIAAYGHDPNLRQESVQAIWQSKEDDRPVTVTGIMGRREDEDYLQAEETSTGKPILTGIPRTELKWIQGEALDEMSDIERELKSQIKDLQSTVESMDNRLRELEQKNIELEQKNIKLEQRNTELEEEVAQLTAALKVAMDERAAGETVAPLAMPDMEPEISERHSEATRLSNWISPWRERISAWRDRAYTLPGRAWESRSELTPARAAIVGTIIGGAAVWLAMKNGNNGIDIDQILNNPDYGLKAQDIQQGTILDQLNNPDHGLGALADQHANIQQHIEGAKDQITAAIESTAVGPSGGSELYDTQSLNFYGDTVWHHVGHGLRNELGYQPTDTQIQRATQRALDLNGLSWADARHLRVGFDFKMPKNLSG